jgi:hypothetical protein
MTSYRKRPRDPNKRMREVLMAAKEKADCGELTVLKPWIKAAS